ncbi:hypothetical protein CSB09_04135 [Candidatus Gracilibacteria bacterium]|nr:MAG: hypothetical protein CSB09_04135 [Candidatus Gracilibacteria bacterium]
MGLRNKRPHSLVYSVKRKGVYSGKKVEKAIKHYKKLLKREELEGNTLWIQNAKKIVLAKFKKYSINPAKI